MPKKKKKTIARGNRRNSKRRRSTRQILIDPKANQESIDTPEEEAKVERMLNALAENRRNRKRKLLPNLRLTYPSDDESRTIAKLARINYSSWFAHHINSIILDAHLSHASFLTLSTPQVRKTLEGVASQADRLGSKLRKLDVGREAKGSEYYAGWLIETELAIKQFKIGGMVLIPEYVELLEAISSACQRANRGQMPVPKGASGNYAFDQLIENLVMAARMSRGGWTVYRSRDGTWKGTLLEALRLLEKYLPAKFFPIGELGRSVEHIRKKLADHTRRARDRQQS